MFCLAPSYSSLYFLYQLLGLFSDQVVGQVAADGFYIIMSTSDDVMVNPFCANIKVSGILFSRR